MDERIVMATLAHGVEKAHNAVAMNRIGLWIFFKSETFLFGVVISTRHYLLGVQPEPHLNQVLRLGLTAILLLSSLTAYRSEAAASNGDQRRFLRNLLCTILLGLVFMAGVGMSGSRRTNPLTSRHQHYSVLCSLLRLDCTLLTC